MYESSIYAEFLSLISYIIFKTSISKKKEEEEGKKRNTYDDMDDVV